MARGGGALQCGGGTQNSKDQLKAFVFFALGANPASCHHGLYWRYGWYLLSMASSTLALFGMELNLC